MSGRERGIGFQAGFQLVARFNQFAALKKLNAALVMRLRSSLGRNRQRG